MIAGDAAVLDELCSDDLIYTHSKGDHDDKRSYLHKVGSRYFTYLEITHPADRILVVDSAALVTGRMWIIDEGAPRSGRPKELLSCSAKRTLAGHRFRGWRIPHETARHLPHGL
jgi:hypothetical protein